MDQNVPISSRPMLALISLGAASVSFLVCLVALVSPHHHILYHLNGSASPIFIAVVVDVFLLAAALFALLLLSRPYAGIHRVMLCALMCLAPWAAYRGLSGSVRWMPLPSLARDNGITIVLGCAFVLLALLRSPFGNRLFLRAWDIAHAVFSIGGCVAIVTLLQACWFGWQARHVNDPMPSAEPLVSASTTAPHGRVLWIVFDELGYEQLNGDRLPGLQLPNFDRFTAQASDLESVIPAGSLTEAVLPALMTGAPVHTVWLSSDGRRFRLIAPGNSRPWNSADTVFHDARNLGYHNGVAGWYIPYCRMAGSELSSCSWSSHPTLEDFYPSASLAANIPHPFVRLAVTGWHLLTHPHGLTPDEQQEGLDHIFDYNELSRAADRALADPNLNFLLLHLPIPHPDGIWDRTTGNFAIDHSNYVDNLALADRYLGHLRSVLEAEGEWDDATILIIGDHGWRTTTQWASDPIWSAADIQASHGRQVDHRPAYLLKLPNQHQAAKVAQNFNALRTRALLDALLAHQISGPGQLQAWITSQPPLPPDSGTSASSFEPPSAQ